MLRDPFAMKPASPHLTFAIICDKSPVDRCNSVQVAWPLDLHKLAHSCTSWHGPPLPGQIRIPSLAPSFPEESVHPPDFCYGFAIKFSGNPDHTSPGLPCTLFGRGFSLPATSRRVNHFSSFLAASPFRGSCCSVRIAARSCLSFLSPPAGRCQEPPVQTRSQRPIKDL